MGKKIMSEILGHSGTFQLLGESESVAKYGDLLGICALHLIHQSVNTHTPGAVGSHLAVAHREHLGGSVPYLSHSIEGGRERWLFTSATYNSCRTWDSNPQPSGYKTDSNH